MHERSIIASAIMHASIIFAAGFAWPHAILPPEDSPPVVPVELVTVADVTNISATVEEPKPAPPPEQPPQPQIETPPPPPPVAEVAPTEPEKKPPPPPKKVEAQVKPPSNPVIPRPKPQKEPPPPKFDLNDVVALLDNQRPKAAPPANAKPAETTQKGFGEQTALTMDVRDALLAQMRECWNVPVGAPNPEQLIVQVRVFLAPDGSLAQPPLLEPASRAAAASNPYMRTAAEAALRAINVCEPYKQLPPERYAAWREIVMTFDPSKMIGR